jgi:hypothetical protein
VLTVADDPEGASTNSSLEVDKPVGIDKSVLAFPAPRRYRDREHLRYVPAPRKIRLGAEPRFE